MAKEKKGLGMGLDALFAADEKEEDGSELLRLPISKVEPRSEQPRETFDEQALQELADSIAQYGVIQPIVARKLDTGYYQIIAGERRWRAARMAGLEEVPAVETTYSFPFGTAMEELQVSVAPDPAGEGFMITGWVISDTASWEAPTSGGSGGPQGPQGPEGPQGPSQ